MTETCRICRNPIDSRTQTAGGEVCWTCSTGATTKATTQWLYRVLEQDDDGDPLDFGAVSAASLPEAQALVTQHLADILGDDGWEGLPVRFYGVTRATGVWETDTPLVDVELDLTTVLTVTRADDDPTRYNDPE